MSVLSWLSLEITKSNFFVCSFIHWKLRNYTGGIHDKITQIWFCLLPWIEGTLPSLVFHPLLCKELGKKWSLLSKPRDESYCSGRLWCIKFWKVCHILLEVMHFETWLRKFFPIFSNPNIPPEPAFIRKAPPLLCFSIESWRIKG